MFDRIRVAACSGVLLFMGCSLSAEHRAEELRCGRYKDPRSVEICRTIAEEMEWSLMGHAAPAPGYKTTIQTSVRVYCRLGLAKNDVEALKPLVDTNPWVSSAAEDLLELLGARPASEVSVFNPEHRDYVLKGGCPAL
jgi:hypothetical protein